jgi:hypothetical protein
MAKSRCNLRTGPTVPIPQSAEKKVMARAAQEAAQPNGVVTGNCGSSYITVQEKPSDGNPVSIATGFTVDLPATPGSPPSTGRTAIPTITAMLAP